MRLRFTIRDLLWLTVVVALAIAWWADRSRILANPYFTRIPDKARAKIEAELELQYESERHPQKKSLAPF
jgi:hypothetical protein